MAVKTKDKISKDIAKDLSGVNPVKKSNKQQRYVAERNVEKYKKDGWKEAGKTSLSGIRDKVFGIKTHQADLTLMEK